MQFGLKGAAMPARLAPASASAADRYAAGVISHQVPTERDRLQLLEHMLDRETISTLEQRGIHWSWRCLELGAGAGSVARWLASRCPDGQVVATDIGTTFLTEVSAPNLQVRRHDVVTEDFPLRSFDLIHARWLLVNVPQREEVLRKIVSWLAPGGWLVTEDVEFSPVDSSPHPPVQRLMNAFEQLLADSHGADFRWGRRRLPTALAEAGLVELGMSMSVKCVGDGGPAEAFYRSSMSQARDGLVGLGLLSEAEYTAGIATLDDPAVIDTPIANLAAWGRATGR
jgi:SAM-dependent methyltransferase